MGARIGIGGASGYAGGELVRLVDGHPAMQLEYLAAHTRAGERLGTVHPHLRGGERVLRPMDLDALGRLDLVFLALPHGASTEPAMELVERGVRVVDLGADFRLDTPQRYEEAYGEPHRRPDELGTWPYGIPELFGDDIAGADRVAIPGCYPTSVVLALAPLVAAGVVTSDDIVVSSMSGVSGAGRSLKPGLLFGAVAESVKAYGVTTHRHRPEMERALEAIGGRPATVTFTPHLVPVQRGILSTCHATVVGGTDPEGVLREAYDGAAFVEVVDTAPETRWVTGSNRCLLSVHPEPRTGRVIVVSALDNLLKGAAGQAVQCANLMLGFDEAAGLPVDGWMP